MTLAPDEKNQLEIHRYILLLQPVFHREELFVVGISKDYEGALELVEEITQEVYNKTKSADIRSYILDRERKNRMLHILLLVLKIIGIIIAAILEYSYCCFVLFFLSLFGMKSKADQKEMPHH